MTDSASILTLDDWKQLDDRLRRVDEDRWLSSRYAPEDKRRALIALYLFYYELARVRLVVTEATLGAIRFQWWRDAIEELRQGQGRQHDTVSALRDAFMSGATNLDALEGLIDAHEAAFEAGDRAAEPEAQLGTIAMQILSDAHDWGEAIKAIAPHWAAMRRGEDAGHGPPLAKVPSALRPAIAHYRLRRLYAKGQSNKPLQRRLCILHAIFSGKI